MSERDTFIRAISEAWDDPTPILVFADWADEHGTDNPALLRWHGWHVAPALARIPSKCPHTSNGARDRAAKAIGQHPQMDILFRCAAVACCRRPAVWDGVEKASVRSAVALCRMLALGLADDATRARDYRQSNAAANALTPQITAAYAGGHFTLVGQLEDRSRAFLLAAEILAERPHLVRTSVADRAIFPVAEDQRADERTWQTAVYEALSRVPPIVTDEAKPPVVELTREVETKDLPPMKLPRGKFRRIVVRGHAYGWQVRTHPDDWQDLPYEIVARSADNTGQRLRVRPAPPVILPGLVARIMGDALDGGWQPAGHGLPDFPWDGTPYLPPGRQ